MMYKTIKTFKSNIVILRGLKKLFLTDKKGKISSNKILFHFDNDLWLEVGRRECKK